MKNDEYVLDKQQQELELSRERTEVLADTDTVAGLESAVPFVIGAEYLDGKWIGGAFAGLHAIFQREIAAYEGMVAMYLAEQSQQLRVPERIFFHLVESSLKELAGYRLASVQQVENYVSSK